MNWTYLSRFIPALLLFTGVYALWAEGWAAGTFFAVLAMHAKQLEAKA